MNLVKLIYIILIFSFVSCNAKNIVTKEELNEYIRNSKNGLLKKETINDFDISLCYYPVDLLLYNDYIFSDSTIKLDSINNLRQQYSRNLYFRLSLALENNNDPVRRVQFLQQIHTHLNVLLFKLPSHIQLLNSERDTLLFKDYVYPRLYEGAQQIDLLLVFENDTLKRNKDLKLFISDFGLNTGNQEFEFSKKNIDELPKLDFEKLLYNNIN